VGADDLNKSLRRFILPLGCLPAILLIVIMIIIYMWAFFVNILLIAIVKLGISNHIALTIVLSMFLGSFINIPIYRVSKNKKKSSSELFNFDLYFLKNISKKNNIIAVNVGGCVIPTLLVIYEIIYLYLFVQNVLLWLFLIIFINIIVCYYFAKLNPKIGIVLSPLIPAFIASCGAIIASKEWAPPIAFCAGVLGPLIGADLLHLKDVYKMDAPVASIGGAGTFDGIVLSALLAVLLVF
jgi:uncharacterized membrane protein